jgi:NAD(P)-dependent dehydrogenase (short-subunit alcohol dehydrogenase family)
VTVVQADLTHQGPLTALVDSVDSVDFLVLSARDSTLRGAPFRNFPAQVASETINLKLLGYWNVVQQMAPKLNADASIVLFAGVMSSRPTPGAAATAVANAGVEGLGRALAVELAPVRVNVLSPGLTATAAFSGIDEAERLQWFDEVAQSLPAQRVGQPKDAADAVRFLLMNRHVTGTVLTLDGGQRLV